MSLHFDLIVVIEYIMILDGKVVWDLRRELNKCCIRVCFTVYNTLKAVEIVYIMSPNESPLDLCWIGIATTKS